MSNKSIGIRIEAEHKGTIAKLRKDAKDGDIDSKDKQIQASIAAEHTKEDKQYYPKLKGMESLKDLTGVDAKIAKFFASKSKIMDNDVHKLADDLNMSPDKLEGRIYAILKRLYPTKEQKRELMAVKDTLKRGHPGRGDRGACGGVRRRDASGQGVGNRELMTKGAERKQTKMGKVMREFKAGTLRSSSGKKITKRSQAIAIGISEAEKHPLKKSVGPRLVFII